MYFEFCRYCLRVFWGFTLYTRVFVGFRLQFFLECSSLSLSLWVFIHVSGFLSLDFLSVVLWINVLGFLASLVLEMVGILRHFLSVVRVLGSLDFWDSSMHRLFGFGLFLVCLFHLAFRLV
ncbi:hypothetical protein QQP08_003462 [Theobroma cacao]|nr:hypothetical protein QQP08_003462 [Theobroma cacao]